MNTHIGRVASADVALVFFRTCNTRPIRSIGGKSQANTHICVMSMNSHDSFTPITFYVLFDHSCHNLVDDFHSDFPLWSWRHQERVFHHSVNQQENNQRFTVFGRTFAATTTRAEWIMFGSSSDVSFSGLHIPRVLENI